MRLISYDASHQAKLQADKKVAMRFSIFLGVLLFFLGLGGGFGVGLILGLVSFAIFYGLIYGLRLMITKKVYRKLSEVQVEGTYLEVYLQGEMGLLVFTPTVVRYHPLQAGSLHKALEIPINEDLFMAFGDIKPTAMAKLRSGGLPQGFVMLRQMPHGLVRQFLFFEVDGAIEKVGAVLNEISQFRAEKYQ